MICCTKNQRTSTSVEIDKMLKEDLKHSKKTLKILILGTSASGKSTIAKQLKILHCDGFTEDELENYKQILNLNIFNGLKELLFLCEQSNISVTKKNLKLAKYFAQIDAYNQKLDSKISVMAKRLWMDKGIQRAWNNRNIADAPTNLEYIMEHIDRFALPDYVPTNTDVLYARQRTTGIVETKFKVDKFQWSLIDVGGQRSERRKWIHFFDDASIAVIYCSALDEYNMVVSEDTSKNKLLETLDVFEETVNSDWCARKTFILFLNKTDLFKKKITSIPLNKWFPEYKGYSYEHAVHYIKKLHLRRVKNRSASEIYVHQTCAINSNDVNYVFNAVSKTIFSERLKLSGVLL